jgi:glycosyltransferase involved in cell wall biosynthesis
MASSTLITKIIVKGFFNGVNVFMLSVIVITKNEEKNIKACLSSVTWADEIIVLDSGSTDNTISIAKTFTEHVFSTDWQGYGIQKQRALLKASGDWVLNLDADEVVSLELRDTIFSVTKNNEADAFRIPIRMSFYNQLLRYSSSPARHIRLFRKDIATYSHDVVHEKVLLAKDARIKQLYTPIIHYSVRDVCHVLDKINHYSSESAKIRLQNKRPQSLLKTMLGTCWMFFRCYILQRGFMDGKAGFLFAIFNAQGSFYRGIKQLYPDD